MLWFRIFFIIFASIFLSGCSNHPLMEDFVRDHSAHKIVMKVHCEAKISINKYYNLYGFNQLEARRDRELNHSEELGKEIEVFQNELDKISSLRTLLLAQEHRNDNGLVKNSLALKALRERIERTKSDYKEEEKFIISLKALVEENDGDEKQKYISQLMTAKNELNVLNESIKKYENLINGLEKKEKDLADIQSIIQNEFIEFNEKSKKIQKKINDANKTISKIKKTYEKLDEFNKTEVAFSFRFDVTENNDATSTGMVTWPIHLGTFQIGFNAGSKKERASQRDIHLSSTVKSIHGFDCDDTEVDIADGRAKFYPISGHLGVDKLFDQYFKISKVAEINNGDGKKFVDTITFTTTLNGDVTPKVDLKTPHMVEIDASGTYNTKRNDIHELVVYISPKEKKSGSTAEKAKIINVKKFPDLNIKLDKDKGLVDQVLE